MKTLVFVVCLLAVAYAVNLEKVKNFYKLLPQCADKFGKPHDVHQMDGKIASCIAKNENLYDEQDSLIIDKSFQYLNDIYTLADKVKGILSDCMQQEYEDSLSNYETSVEILDCLMKQNVTQYLAKESQ